MPPERPAAVLDACVLWPNLQRDFLLSMADRKLYTPAWGNGILDEVARNERVKLSGMGMDDAAAGRSADHLLRQMRTGFPEAEVRGYEQRVGSYGLPDRDDEHVVATAEHAGIGTIVTENRKDFPASRLPSGMEVVSARDFTARVVEQNSEGAREAVQAIADRSGRHGPKMSAEDVLGRLEKQYRMYEAAEIIRQPARSPTAVRGVKAVEAIKPRQQLEQQQQRLGRDRTESRGTRQDRSRDARGTRDDRSW